MQKSRLLTSHLLLSERKKGLLLCVGKELTRARVYGFTCPARSSRNFLFPHPIHEVITEAVLWQQLIGPGVDTKTQDDIIIILTGDLIFLPKIHKFQPVTWCKRENWTLSLVIFHLELRLILWVPELQCIKLAGQLPVTAFPVMWNKKGEETRK